MREVHVIPVPEDMTVEEAWHEIRLLGCLASYHPPVADSDPRWASVLVEDGELVEVL